MRQHILTVSDAVLLLNSSYLLFVLVVTANVQSLLACATTGARLTNYFVSWPTPKTSGLTKNTIKFIVDPNVNSSRSCFFRQDCIVYAEQSLLLFENDS